VPAVPGHGPNTAGGPPGASSAQSKPTAAADVDENVNAALVAASGPDGPLSIRIS
jgi:hypothetical protein